MILNPFLIISAYLKSHKRVGSKVHLGLALPPLPPTLSYMYIYSLPPPRSPHAQLYVYGLPPIPLTLSYMCMVYPPIPLTLIYMYMAYPCALLKKPYMMFACPNCVKLCTTLR